MIIFCQRSCSKYTLHHRIHKTSVSNVSKPDLTIAIGSALELLCLNWTFAWLFIEWVRLEISAKYCSSIFVGSSCKCIIIINDRIMYFDTLKFEGVSEQLLDIVRYTSICLLDTCSLSSFILLYGFSSTTASIYEYFQLNLLLSSQATKILNFNIH